MNDHVAFLKDPNQWGNWPICPVVQRPGKGTGIVIDGKPGKVYLVNMFSLGNGILSDLLEGKEFREYGSWEAMVADGWIVD